jgi:hypothetical protein
MRCGNGYLTKGKDNSKTQRAGISSHSAFVAWRLPQWFDLDLCGYGEDCLLSGRVLRLLLEGVRSRQGGF